MTTIDEMKQKIRSDCDYIWDKMGVFSQHIDKKTLVNGVSLIRKCVSNPNWQAKYPGTVDIYNEHTKHDLQKYAQLAEFSPLHCAIEMGRLKQLVLFPKRYHDNYDDMFPPRDKEGNLMLTYDQWKAQRLRERQADIGELEYVQAELENEKKLRTMYKKYVKEWKTKND